MNFDLEERTAKFSEEIIELCKKVPKNICRKLWQEAHELTLIFSKITRSTI